MAASSHLLNLGVGRKALFLPSELSHASEDPHNGALGGGTKEFSLTWKLAKLPLNSGDIRLSPFQSNPQLELGLGGLLIS